MRFHDARMNSIELGGNHSAVITLSDDGGARYKILFEQLDRMRCLEFREGNIILEFVTYSGTTPPMDVLEKLFDIARQPEVPAYLRTRIKRIEAAELNLVHILPSYGAELIALCGRLDIIQVSSAEEYKVDK
jgi:hypothetical protein